MLFNSYHKDLNSLHIGCEEPRAYFVPFATEEEAIRGERSLSTKLVDLCGVWDFKFYQSFEDIEEDFLDAPFNDKINVPMCWQVNLGKGYDVPLYTNSNYPFMLDPPFVPDENPCGHYNTSFNCDNLGDKVYINFEGVASCFYLFVNKKFVGYSQVSHCTSEFDITDYLVGGENRLDVLVVKWCDGSWLEDQDHFRLSGIFREVYLLGRAKNHLRDFYVKSEVNEALTKADIALELDFDGEVACSFKLFAPDGSLAYEGENTELSLDNPVLWNSEQPQLYTLVIKAGDEYIAQKLALKRLEIKDSVAYLNNKKIKLWGINRHDSNPVTGYGATYGEMLRDLCILKRASVNCIRTSHYPNDPRFMELCNELGFMVVDEADIETHGMGLEYRNDWDWFRWSKLSTDDEWEASYIDRAKRLFERDKNFGCVIMWSLGNESGCGKNHRAMNKYIKSRDSKAIIHYENSHLEFKAVPEGEDFKDISDVESRMYADLGYTENYLKNNPPKPFYYCEYVCAYSTGNIFAHCRMADEYDSFWGLCLWEMNDHSIKVENNGKIGYRYGGDFGDYPNDADCCIDGVVFADRTLRPGYFDMKRAYQPFKVSYKNGKITVFNKRFFTSLKDLELVWSVERNGKSILNGKVDLLDISPRTEKEFSILENTDFDGNTYLNLSFIKQNQEIWCDVGYEIGFEQFELHTDVKRNNFTLDGAKVEDSRRFLTVKTASAEFVFDKAYGKLNKIIADGKNILAAPIEIETWMAHPKNLCGNNSDCNERRSAAMDKTIQKCYACKVERGENELKVICDVAIGGPSVLPVIKGKITYTFGDGGVKLAFAGDKNPQAPSFPKFGFRLMLDKAYTNLAFYGLGPGEAYVDRLETSKIGLYKMYVADNFVHYIRPMENSAHAKTRFGTLTDVNGNGLMVSVNDKNGCYFNASHFLPEMLEEKKHDDELVPLDEVVVSADKHIVPFGGHGYYDSVEPQRVFDDSKIDFEIALTVVNAEIDPFDYI